MPVYFHATAREGGAKVKLSEALHQLGYVTGDEVEIEQLGGAGTFAIRPCARPREEMREIETPDPFYCPELPQRQILTWTRPEAQVLLGEYNRGRYRGRSNLGLDREAYGLFENGLVEPGPRLVKMLAHVGEFYGGAFRPHGAYQDVASEIATGFRGRTKELREILERQVPLTEAVPNVHDVHALLAPFRRDKTWFVWGAKFLHFLRPDVFPIIDSRVERALGLHQRISNSTGYLVSFCSVVREVLATNKELIDQLTDEDEGSPTALKTVDKMLWVIGSRIRDNERRLRHVGVSRNR